jgi:hypothetical protein
MSARFEELDWSETLMGVISLRRRIEPSLNVDVYEVKLGDEFLMSSLFTVAEVELARLGLAEALDADLDVVVGGLGLGYTAQAALNDARIHSLVVVEALGEVIGWHRRALLPDTAELVSDPRVRLQRGDFFAMADSTTGFDPEAPGRRFHAVLLDIDHTPRHVLHRATARSTPLRDWESSSGTCIPAESSRYGPMIRPTLTSRRSSPRSSTGPRHPSSGSPTR